MPSAHSHLRRSPRRARTWLVLLCTAAALAPTAGLGPAPAGAQGPDVAPTPAPALATPVFSARRVPELLRSTIAGDQVREAVEPLLAQAPENSCLVVSTGGGHVVVRHNGDRPMVPASTAKIVTATAILDQLDPEARLSTTVVAAEPPRDGVVEGDLHLVGGGDPLLTTPGYEPNFLYPGQLTNQYAQLADRIVTAGVREVRGDVVGDDSRYDTQRWVPTWPTRYQREDTVGPLSALMVNDGSTGLSTSPDEVASGRQPGDPPLLAAETLITYLEQRGVSVSGGPSVGPAPDGGNPVATLESPTIREIVSEMVLVSDNTTAELLVKELGLARSGRGTTADGLAALTGSLAEDGLPTAGLAMFDGSGLDPQNRLTCDLLVAALDEAGADSDLAAMLPVSAETGTLYNRMRRTPAAGRVRAKSGTLSTVNALAGFVDTESGARLTFAFLINGPEQPRGFMPIDEMMSALVAVPAGPSIDELAPRRTGG